VEDREKEGRLEGRFEGLLEAKRDAVYEILKARFGDVLKGIKEAVEKVSDFKRLSLIVRKSVTVKDFDEFREYLK